MQGIGWLGLGAFAGVITALFARAGVVWGWLVGQLWVRIEIEDEIDRRILLSYLLAECREARGRTRRYQWMLTIIRETNQVGHVPREMKGHVPREMKGQVPLLLFRGWAPILYSPPPKAPRAETNAPAGSTPGEASVAAVSFVRGTFDADALVTAATRRWHAESFSMLSNVAQTSRFVVVPLTAGGSVVTHGRVEGRTSVKCDPGDNVTPLVGFTVDDLGSRIGSERLAGLYYPPEVYEEVARISRWARSKEVYEKLGIPWRRGVLLHGPGGTGKTAFVVAVAKELNCPVFSFRLAGMSCAMFVRHWDSVQCCGPCVALFEDIDGVFMGRENISRKDVVAGLRAANHRAAVSQSAAEVADDLLTFDVLLNCLDGASRSTGVLVVVTTNHADKIDPALGGPATGGDGTTSTRPGRIDRVIELKHMRLAEKEPMIRGLLRDFPELAAEVLADRDSFERDETPAQVQERVGQLALAAYEASLCEEFASAA